MPVIVEPRYDVADLEADLAHVYADFPGRTPQQCLTTIRDALRAGGVFYAAAFNGRQVAGALVSGPTDARRIALVAVRAVTRNRGVGLRLIDEISRLEKLTGGRELVITATPDAVAALTALGFTASSAGDLRKPLQAG